MDQHAKIQRNTELLFLKSALTLQNPFNTTEEVLQWIRKRNNEVEVKVAQLPFDKMLGWGFADKNYRLEHESGKFFFISGIEVRTNWGEKPVWDQPIINQPEIGYLGFITREIKGILYFLIQAKIEPGNVNYVQLSPTLQATKSNYTQVHKGKRPSYIEYFLDRKNNQVLLDQLQSEQGARFLKKRNRNIIIKVDPQLEVLEDFCWLTLGQIKELMKIDNVVNMDTRTVISGIPYGSIASEALDFSEFVGNAGNQIGKKMLRSELVTDKALFSFNQIIHWFTNLKTIYELNFNIKSLEKLQEWDVQESRITHKEHKYFDVIAVNVHISNREVTSWDQPLIKPLEHGLCAFLIKEINGVIHFLVQAKVESGNFDILEMAPTVQCITGSYKNEKSFANLHFLKDVLDAEPEQLLYDTLQSEEGGRFYREQNRNLIIKVSETFPLEVPENYIWMTLNQLKKFILFNNYLNIQARSIISSISFN
nr:NDP-hexose 2,3-dehydratase family protein [uncultured Allomuricauda sp.]